jgi:endonuclease V-like protein UPF0215 family
VTRWNEWNELQQIRNQGEDHVAVPMGGRLIYPRTHTPPVITLDGARVTAEVKLRNYTDDLKHINARVVVLSGYICASCFPFISHCMN